MFREFIKKPECLFKSAFILIFGPFPERFEAAERICVTLDNVNDPMNHISLGPSNMGIGFARPYRRQVIMAPDFDFVVAVDADHLLRDIKVAEYLKQSREAAEARVVEMQHIRVRHIRHVIQSKHDALQVHCDREGFAAHLLNSILGKKHRTDNMRLVEAQQEGLGLLLDAFLGGEVLGVLLNFLFVVCVLPNRVLQLAGLLCVLGEVWFVVFERRLELFQIAH